MLGPEAGILGIGSYNVFAILIRQGKFNPKTKIGKSIKDAVIKIMSLGYSDEDKYDLLKDISKAEQERKEEKGGKIVENKLKSIIIIYSQKEGKHEKGYNIFYFNIIFFLFSAI